MIEFDPGALTGVASLATGIGAGLLGRQMLKRLDMRRQARLVRQRHVTRRAVPQRAGAAR